MATISAFVSPNYLGFDTDSFFLPGLAAAQTYPHSFSGGGTLVLLTYSTLNLRLTYTGSNLVY